MTTPLTYDFSSSWSIAWGHLVPIALSWELAALGSWRVNVDAWAWLASPHAMAHHRAADPGRWRTLLEASGDAVLSQPEPAFVTQKWMERRAPNIYPNLR